MCIAREGMCELKDQVKNFSRAIKKEQKDGKSKQKINMCDGYMIFIKYIIFTKQRGRIISRNRKVNFTKLRKR